MNDERKEERKKRQGKEEKRKEERREEKKEKKIHRGPLLAWLVEQVTLDLGLMSLSPTLEGEVT